MSPEQKHIPGQLNIFSERAINAEQNEPRTQEVAGQIGSRAVPEVVDTGVHQDLLEYYERQAEFHERFPLGQNTYNAFTIIGLDKSAHKAQMGNSGNRFALTRQGRSAEDIRRASERYNDSNAKLARKFADLVGVPIMKAAYRAQIEASSLSEPEKVNQMANIERRIDGFASGRMLDGFKDKFIDSKDAAKNRRKAESNLKKGIKLQKEMRAKMQADKLGVERPTYFK